MRPGFSILTLLPAKAQSRGEAVGPPRESGDVRSAVGRRHLDDLLLSAG